MFPIPNVPVRSQPLFTLLVGAAIALSGCSPRAATTTSPQQTVSGMVVTLKAGSPHTGDNTLTVTLADAATQASIGNANITAKADMLSPRLPGTDVSGRAQGNGRYEIPVRLGIATRYNIVLHIERPSQPVADVSFPLEAAQ